MQAEKPLAISGQAGASSTTNLGHTAQRHKVEETSSRAQDDNSTVNPDEAFCKRTTFYVNADWELGHAARYVSGQMFVESLEPLWKSQPYPIVLIHGDFHTGQVWLTKPDGNPGWASYFLQQGYHVYCLDLPTCGRSNPVTKSQVLNHDIGSQVQSLEAAFVERELTAPEKQPHLGKRPAWPTAHLHDKWPGTGQRGDPIFIQYCSSLSTVIPKKAERQTLGQNALRALLNKIGKSILLAEGSGCVISWLTADIVPDLVEKVVAIEPSGPPCGVPFTNYSDGRAYSSYVKYSRGVRKYGLADIPLGFEPPLPLDHTGSETGPLDVVVRQLPDNAGCYLSQKPIERFDGMGRQYGGESFRQLVNLKKMAHAVLTAHASPHSTFDWATVLFMQQSGVDVQWIKTEEYNILGNGHLMFLETNSDAVASVINSWIQKGCSQKKTGYLTPPLEPNSNPYICTKDTEMCSEGLGSIQQDIVSLGDETLESFINTSPNWMLSEFDFQVEKTETFRADDFRHAPGSNSSPVSGQNSRAMTSGSITGQTISTEGVSPGGTNNPRWPCEVFQDKCGYSLESPPRKRQHLMSTKHDTGSSESIAVATPQLPSIGAVVGSPNWASTQRVRPSGFENQQPSGFKPVDNSVSIGTAPLTNQNYQQQSQLSSLQGQQNHSNYYIVPNTQQTVGQRQMTRSGESSHGFEGHGPTQNWVPQVSWPLTENAVLSTVAPQRPNIPQTVQSGVRHQIASSDSVTFRRPVHVPSRPEQQVNLHGDNNATEWQPPKVEQRVFYPSPLNEEYQEPHSITGGANLSEDFISRQSTLDDMLLYSPTRPIDSEFVGDSSRGEA